MIVCICGEEVYTPRRDDIIFSGHVLGDISACGVKVCIKLIGLKSEFNVGCEIFYLSYIFITNSANDATWLPEFLD